MKAPRPESGMGLLVALIACFALLPSCKPATLSSVRSEQQTTDPLKPTVVDVNNEPSEEKKEPADESEPAFWKYPKGMFVVEGATWKWARAASLNAMGPIDAGCAQVANKLSPSTNALLHMIAFAEGTEHRYDVFFTHARVTNNCDKHPRKIHSSGGLSSDAAGRYQFLSGTWSSAADNLSLTDFRSPSQDRAAVYLIERIRGVKDHAETQASFTGFSRWMAKLTNEWASIPGNSYGQAQKGLTVRVLWEAYRSALKPSDKEP